MLKLTIEVNAKTVEDLETALEEAKSKVTQGYTSGGDKNEDSQYNFEVSGEEVTVPETEDVPYYRFG